MFRPLHLPVLLAAAVVVAWPSGIAYSTGTLTPKQARLQGLVATVKQREPMVDKLIVKLRTPKSQTLATAMTAARTQSLAKTAGTGMKSLRATAGGAHVMQLDRAVSLSQARAMAARLAQDAEIEYAEPNIWFRRLAVPNEPRFAQWQWNLFAPASSYTGNVNGSVPLTTTAVGGANLPAAWDYTTGSPDVIVAIIDTGIVNHPDLNGVPGGSTYVPAGRFLPGYDFVSSDLGTGLPANFVANDGNGRDADPSDPGDWITADDKAKYPDACDDGTTGASDSSWHGSHVAGVVAATANNNVGIAGVGWSVKVVPVRALGKCGGALLDIEEAIRWAAGLPVPGVPANPYPAQVINLSLGGDTCGPTMQAAVDAAIAAGSVVVAATGNEGNIGLISPADCNGVVAVTAHTISGENADYSNIGSGTTISAPGGGPPFYTDPSAPKHVTDNVHFDGYYIFSTVLFGATTPTSTSGSGTDSGSAYVGFTGTSPATPHVTGVAALLKSAVPEATPAQIRSFLVSGARAYATTSPCAPTGAFAGMCGAGLLDAGRALAATGDSASPAAAAGLDQVVAPGATVALNGGGSKAFNGKTISSYQWTQTEGAAVALNNANTVTASFTAPATGTLTFRLRVTDNMGKTGDDFASVRVNNAPVLAAAPAAPTATVGAVVSFSISATDADGDALTYVAGAASTVPLTALSPAGQFVWNTAGYAPGSYTLAYFATDGIAQSATQTVIVTLTAPASAANPPSGGGGGAWNWAGVALLLSLLLLRATATRQRKGQPQ